MNDQATYKILFYGQCKEGFRLKDVKQNLGIFLHKPVEGLEKVFSGKTVVVKRSNNAYEISRFAEHLAAIGMVVHIDPPLPSGAPEKAPAPTPAPEPVPAQEPVAIPSQTAASLEAGTMTPTAAVEPELILDLSLAPTEPIPVSTPTPTPIEPAVAETIVTTETIATPEIIVTTESTTPKTTPVVAAEVPKVAVKAPKKTNPAGKNVAVTWLGYIKKIFNAANKKSISKKSAPTQKAQATHIAPIGHPTPTPTPTPSNSNTVAAPIEAVVTKTPTTVPVKPVTAPPKAVTKLKTPKLKPGVNIQQKIKYRFDTFMARGGSSIFMALLAVFLVIFALMALLRGLLQHLHPELHQQEGELDFTSNLYMAFLQLTDPGNMAQDLLSSGWYKLLAILGGFIGIILFSALIAFITTAVDQKISALKRGRSKVIEKGHTLILGWNEQRIVEIIRELVIAQESERDACVVVLADYDKELMDDLLRLRLPELGSTRIVTRHGRVSTLANLDMASIEHCRSVIVLANCEDTDSPEKKTISDASVIQNILAVTSKLPEKSNVSIVAEIFNHSYREIISHTFANQVVTINTSDILAKLLVQTSRSVGLSTVYNEILSFDGCEMYFHQADWKGMRFGELAFHFADGVPMGVMKANGDLLLNPTSHYIMDADDKILILANDDSSVKFQPTACAHGIYFPLPDRQLHKAMERELIIGWNHKARVILQEFSDYVTSGSQINIVLANPTDAERDEIRELNEIIPGVDIQLLQLNPLNRNHLLEIQPFSYNNIIILASVNDDHDAQQVDSENLVTLLLLRSIFNEYPAESESTKLITEVLDSQNLPLVARAGVRDVIISSRLVSMVIAQVSQSKDMKQVYDDLFSEEGSEIYVKPASLYFDKFPVNVTYADLIVLAHQRNEICLGIKIKARETDAAQNNGIKLVPPKMELVTLTAEDSLVVLAENEF